MPQMTFKAFELQERERSPNAVMGILEDGKRVFFLAPVPGLGKALGDEIANVVRKALECEYIRPKLAIRPVETQQIECPKCHTIQNHTYPMTGKLHCQGCGELLDEISE